MRYIQKVETPQFFKNNSIGVSTWNEYKASKKPLREYILKHEQNDLCVYCESQVTSSNSSSHIEHIRPKAQDKYPELTFEYTNLTVSCNGNCHIVDDNVNHNCEHRKDKVDTPFCETKFLNPVELKNIRDYFKYDIDEGTILASSKNELKANYMIDTLELNSSNSGLKKARKIALEVFRDDFKKLKDIRQKKELIIRELNKEERPFISFLRYRFRRLLNQNT